MNLEVLMDCVVCHAAASYKADNGNYICASCGPRVGMTEAHRISPMPADPPPGPPPDEFGAFSAAVRDTIEGKALAKGYASEDDGSVLRKFVDQFFPGHALGEVVYKAVRYSRKGDPTDLIKIAAWAYLVWRGDPLEEEVATAFVANYDTIDEVRAEVDRAMASRPNVVHAGPVRLVALVVEEVGEAMKDVLDATRGNLDKDALRSARGELIQTAAMAVIAASVLKERM